MYIGLFVLVSTLETLGVLYTLELYNSRDFAHRTPQALLRATIIHKFLRIWILSHIVHCEDQGGEHFGFTSSPVLLAPMSESGVHEAMVQIDA